MSPTVAIVLITVADLMIIGLLAYVMSLARHLTPRGATLGLDPHRPVRPFERQRPARHVTAAPAVVSPARS